MPKIKLTKNELKSQRDALKRFERYLPTLQLKKQQLQMEVRRVQAELNKLAVEERQYRQELEKWVELLQEEHREPLEPFFQVTEWVTSIRNVAGIDTPTFEKLTYQDAEMDLFLTPSWYDDAVDSIRKLARMVLQQQLVREQLHMIREELRVTTQRVNLFEKVKIPETRESIRRIQIYLGDQQTAAVGRAKIAKRKATAAAS